METFTSASESREPAATLAIHSAHHPVARRIADVLRNRSERPGIFVLDDLENIEQAIACGVEVDSLYLSASADTSSFAGIDAEVPRYVLDDSAARTLFGDQKRSRAFSLAHAPRRPRLCDLIGTTGYIVILVQPLGSIRAARGRLALVMGGEREGVSRELDALTTYRYSIPMASNVESLNVSVTAGIALFEHRTG